MKIFQQDPLKRLQRVVVEERATVLQLTANLGRRTALMTAAEQLKAEGILPQSYEHDI